MLHGLYLTDNCGKIIGKVTLPTNPIPQEKEHFIEALVGTLSKLLEWEVHKPLRLDLNSYRILILPMKGVEEQTTLWILGIGDKNDNVNALARSLISIHSLLLQMLEKEKIAGGEQVIGDILSRNEEKLRNVVWEHVRLFSSVRSGGLSTLLIGLILASLLFLITEPLLLSLEAGLFAKITAAANASIIINEILILSLYSIIIGLITGILCGRSKETITAITLAALLMMGVCSLIFPTYVLPIIVTGGIIIAPIAILTGGITAEIYDRRKLTFLPKYRKAIPIEELTPKGVQKDGLPGT
ncbi:MAG: hypothetical protein ACTSX9_08865 [Candidatus Njordarchaeales archaeon]